MSTKALVNKSNKKPKFKTRAYTRCQLCGRARAVYRKFKICRLCLRKLALEGKIPGLKKASW
ncbi:MAG: type Z 30S ribosomal protein S14 [Planctomycetes bacterium HGW-Planctomycetes-1]|nr:MAG: type Z 30S ribosomal protein S14 [Planctomycetes bacterium HGW-Planctomycetes-1]